MNSDFAAPRSTGTLAPVPADQIPACAALVERKRAESAHRAPWYELQCRVASMGRIDAVRRQLAGLASSDVRGPVLELCCGTGGVTAELARMFDEVTGVDLSPDMLARAALRMRREHRTNVRLREAEVSTLRYPAASFSAVVISLGMHELPWAIRGHVLEQTAVWLKPGGRFVCCDYVKPRNRLMAAILGWGGRRWIEKEHFDEFMAYSLEQHLERHGFMLVERHRHFWSCLEVSAWTVGFGARRSIRSSSAERGTAAASAPEPSLGAAPACSPTESPSSTADSIPSSDRMRLLRQTDPIRPVLATELAAMTALLAEAFMADPLYQALAPSPEMRGRWLRWVMGMFLRLSHRLGGALCLESAPAAGVICLIPPGHCPPSLTDYARAVPGFPPLGSGMSAFIRRGGAVANLLDGAHFTGVHYYILAVGVAPSEQGKGMGGVLLRSALRLADERGVPCYLETASPRNVALYERLGFRVQRAFAPKELPPLWTMLRAATPELPESADGKAAQ
jgi:ubiquinone/menaquinone biosynthesis C-methylase UbiE/ribosomal protein S18 acetylase RimI-like enzyme